MSNVSERLLNYMKTPEFAEHLNSFEIEDIYNEGGMLVAADVSRLTHLLYDSGIDVLHYIREIPWCCFYHWDMTTMEIPNNITAIGEFAFSKCGNLRTIRLPSSVKTIKQGAFIDCLSLKTIIYEGTKKQWDMVKTEDLAFPEGLKLNIEFRA